MSPKGFARTTGECLLRVGTKELAMSSQYGHHPCSSSLEGTEEVRLRTLWRAAEAWPCVAGLEFPWRGPERTLREVADEASVTHSGDPGTLERTGPQCPSRRAAVVEWSFKSRKKPSVQ